LGAQFPMETKTAKSLRESRLGANPVYELVLFDRLSLSDRQALEGLGRDPDVYGVLRPREDAHLSIKSVSRDMALLWFTLQSPGPLPRYVIQTLGKKCDQVIGQMVLDGILMIEAHGEMLSGPAARAFVCAEQAESGPENSLAALSRRALEYAEALEITDAVALSARLYMYNRLPASTRWKHLLSNPAAVERHLGIRNGATARMLERGWTRLLSGGGAQGWMAFAAHALRPFTNHLQALREPGVQRVARGVSGHRRSHGTFQGFPLEGGKRCLRSFAAGQNRGVFPRVRRLAGNRRVHPGQAGAMPGARCPVHG
jgi:hypothetical protein